MPTQSGGKDPSISDYKLVQSGIKSETVSGLILGCGQIKDSDSPYLSMALVTTSGHNVQSPSSP
jgi:hypothetical protein